MENQITLIIILHNRHPNLDRLLEFYNNFTDPVIVADSSVQKHVFAKETKSNVTYLYMPGTTYTQKIELVLNKVGTPYVALCADDDFIIERGLYSCLDFLNSNTDYSSAQGIIVKYYKNTIGGDVRFDMLYQGDHSLTSADPAKRLSQLFTPYKSHLYAVHRVTVLKAAFANAGTAFTNLYLNEYVASIVPVLMGKHKDLDVLYQVREHADISDDKVADNLDSIIANSVYKAEFTSFLDHMLNKSTGFVNMSREQLRKMLVSVLDGYVDQLKAFKKMKTPLIKRAGLIIEKIPIVGKSLLQNNRHKQSRLSVKKNLSETDHRELEKITCVLNKYGV